MKKVTNGSLHAAPRKKASSKDVATFNGNPGGGRFSAILVCFLSLNNLNCEIKHGDCSQDVQQIIFVMIIMCVFKEETDT